MLTYFEKYGLKADGRAIERFRLFADYLMGENLKYNLTAIRDLDGIVVRHFIDSAVILNHVDFPAGSSIIDIGAGAGFPSVPLAILRGDLRITCVDSSAKKINFIKNTADLLGLENISLHCGRAEDIHGAAHDFAVSRAVARLNILCELAAPVLRLDGVFCAYKSKCADAEIRECGNALEILGLELADTIKFALEGEERALVIIKKVRETPSQYPRSFSQISKRPL